MAESEGWRGHTGNGGDGHNSVWVRVVQQNNGHGSVGSGPGEVHRLASGDASESGIGELEATGRRSVHHAGGGSSHGETSELHFERETRYEINLSQWHVSCDVLPPPRIWFLVPGGRGSARMWGLGAELTSETRVREGD
jgi:hypothetical protein